MSDVPPFGFGLPDRDPERRGEGGEPNAGDPFGLGALFGGIAGGGSPEDLLGKMPLFAELQKLMSWSGGPVNWDLARQGAISQLAAGDAAKRAPRPNGSPALGSPPSPRRSGSRSGRPKPNGGTSLMRPR